MWSDENAEIGEVVRIAAGREDLCNAVAGIYRDIERELAIISPICQMSGRCCHFEEYGHRLFVTTAELGLFVHEARNVQAVKSLMGREDGTGCRFQQGKLCLAHTIRPMGCRLFFCDPRTEGQLQLLYEQLHTRLKRLHDEMGVAYYYMEWRAALRTIRGIVVEAG